ncbi:MAG: c-type cytochrome [Acidobacteria bacterium]|nr:c-type cytochrome [Acidobacteriota bacterium]
MSPRRRAPLALAWLASFAFSGSLTPSLQAATPNADLGLGQKVYEQNCMRCHGSKGRGDGPDAQRLGFRPRDFQFGQFKCRSTASGALPLDEDLLRTVSRGLPGTPMVGFARVLRPEEQQAVIQYIKTFSPRFASMAPPQAIVIAAPPPPLENLREGRMAYLLLKCWQCHGLTGKGDGPSAAGLKDDWGRPIKPADFTRSRYFKCGEAEEELYRTLMTGMNGTPMPSFAEALVYVRDLIHLSDYDQLLPAPEIQEVTDHVREKVPNKGQFERLNPGEREALRQARAWALVRYVRSLLQTGRR